MLIAGTYTPFGLLVLQGAWRFVVLGIVWTGALAAIVFKFGWVDAPTWVSAVIGVVLGSISPTLRESGLSSGVSVDGTRLSDVPR